MDEGAVLIRGSQLRLFPGETHMAPVEVARAFGAEIGSFLAR